MTHLLKLDRRRIRLTPYDAKVAAWGCVRQALRTCAFPALEQRVGFGVEPLKFDTERRAAPTGGPCHRGGNVARRAEREAFATVSLK